MNDPTPFDAGRPWALNPRVSVRPEAFGGLAYHHGTRRLSFLKSRPLVEVLQRLATEPTAHSALVAARIPSDQVPAFEQALTQLAQRDMIVPRDAGAGRG